MFQNESDDTVVPLIIIKIGVKDHNWHLSLLCRAMNGSSGNLLANLVQYIPLGGAVTESETQRYLVSTVDLRASINDMLIFINKKADITEVIKVLENLSGVLKLRLNK